MSAFILKERYTVRELDRWFKTLSKTQQDLFNTQYHRYKVEIWNSSKDEVFDFGLYIGYLLAFKRMYDKYGDGK